MQMSLLLLVFDLSFLSPGAPLQLYFPAVKIEYRRHCNFLRPAPSPPNARIKGVLLSALLLLCPRGRASFFDLACMNAKIPF